MEKDFNEGKPIEEAWFTENLSGGHNPECIAMLFPGISKADNDAIAIDKEARFRKLAGTDAAGLHSAGLHEPRARAT